MTLPALKTTAVVYDIRDDAELLRKYGRLRYRMGTWDCRPKTALSDRPNGGWPWRVERFQLMYSKG